MEKTVWLGAANLHRTRPDCNSVFSSRLRTSPKSRINRATHRIPPLLRKGRAPELGVGDKEKGGKPGPPGQKSDAEGSAKNLTPRHPPGTPKSSPLGRAGTTTLPGSGRPKGHRIEGGNGMESAAKKGQGSGRGSAPGSGKESGPGKPSGFGGAHGSESAAVLAEESKDQTSR